MQIEIGQHRTGMAGAAVIVVNDHDPERRVVLSCALPPAELMASAKMVRSRLLTHARHLATILQAS
jgi:hypothetical protein